MRRGNFEGAPAASQPARDGGRNQSRDNRGRKPAESHDTVLSHWLLRLLRLGFARIPPKPAVWKASPATRAGGRTTRTAFSYPRVKCGTPDPAHPGFQPERAVDP